MFTLVLEKRMDRKGTPEKIVAQIRKISERAMASGRSDRGWSLKADPMSPKQDNGEYVYRYEFKLNCKPKRTRTKESIEQEFNSIVTIIQQAGNVPGWNIITVNGKAFDSSSLASQPIMIPYHDCQIPKLWLPFFDEIYERDDQIQVILSRIRAGITSEWRNRFHSALVGEPAGGKTETARAVKRMLGEKAVLELDATQTTQAGVIKNLKEREELPRVIIIEEIEKADFKQLPWLLAMLDPRAEIRKMNYREKVHLELRGICIATINNYKLFTTVLEGALASRLGEPIFFPKPSESIIRKILTREVERINGNKAWIQPTLEYCKEMDISDPRTAQSICLSGKDDLLKGKYQAYLRATRMPKDYIKC